MTSREIWKSSLAEAKSVLDQFIGDSNTTERLINLSDMILSAFRTDKNVFICGNGGSHCDAMHFAEEWTGRYRKDRPAVGALALGDAAHVTCVGNDYGFDQIFARQISGLGRKGDVLILLSTSGKSKNLIIAAKAARERGLKTFALLGKGGGDLKGLVDDSLTVPGATSDRIQELHMMALHICIEVVERELFPENYT